MYKSSLIDRFTPNLILGRVLQKPTHLYTASKMRLDSWPGGMCDHHFSCRRRIGVVCLVMCVGPHPSNCSSQQETGATNTTISDGSLGDDIHSPLLRGLLGAYLTGTLHPQSHPHIFVAQK